MSDTQRNQPPSVAEYEYQGLIAESWDLLRGDTSGWEDRFYYRDQIARYGQPVLDVGCGTGRLLLDYLAQGIDIDGVDNSPEMLALCERKAAETGLAPRLYCQEMEHLQLPRRYRTILVPSSSLQLVIAPDQAVQAVHRLRDHLEPCGVVIASFMWLWKPGDPLEGRWETSVVRPGDGATISRESWSRYDPTTECEETESRYRVMMNGQVVAEETHRRAPATRAYNTHQARALFEQAGLTEVRLNEGFTHAPAEADASLFTAVGHRAAIA
jgi:SAM-dependent methyltransferase